MGSQHLKATGEDAAAAYLQRRGLRIVERNFRTRFGELDAVCMEGKTLVFVEVKARATSSFVDPAEAVDFRKRQKLRRMAEAFIAFRRPVFEGCRFDVVSVVCDGGRPLIKHIVDAF